MTNSAVMLYTCTFCSWMASVTLYDKLYYACILIGSH